MPDAESTSSTTPQADGSLPLVWNYHEQIWHYRVPVIEGVAERGAGAYDLRMLGEMRDGKPFGGKAAGPRFVELPAAKRGRLFLSSRDVERRVADARPAVLINNASSRNTSAWRLPGIVRGYGGCAIFWSKITGYSNWSTSLRAAYQRRLFNRYDLAILYGEASRVELLGLGFPDESIFVATNTIDTRRIFQRADEYAARAVAIREAHGLLGKKVLLCIGRLDAAKRPLDLIDAWPRLAAIDPDLTLVFVGKGEMSDEVKRRAQQADAGSGRIRFIGPVPDGEDYAWIAAADYTIQCGAVGLAINQSMAFGRATIVADEPGSDAELLVDGQTGFRFRKADLADLVRVVGEVVRDDARRADVGAAARRLLDTDASIDNMTRVIDRCIRRGLEIARDRGGLDASRRRS